MAHEFFTIATYLNKDDALGSLGSRIITQNSDEITAGFGGDIFGVYVPFVEKNHLWEMMIIWQTLIL